MTLADDLEELIAFTQGRLERRAQAARELVWQVDPLPHRIEMTIWRWELAHAQQPLAAELRRELKDALRDLREQFASAQTAIEEASRVDSLDRLRALVTDLRHSLPGDE